MFKGGKKSNCLESDFVKKAQGRKVKDKKALNH
jgi:hypothetical protein